MWSSSQRKSSQQLNTQESDFVSLVTKVMSNLLKQMKQHLEESESESLSVMSHSLRPHGLYSPWNSPGQNTGMGSLSLLQGIFLTQGSNPGLPHCRRSLYQLSHKGSPMNVKVVQLCLTLCDPVDYTIHGIPQARILEWVAFPFSKGSSQCRDRTQVSHIAGGFFTS